MELKNAHTLEEVREIFKNDRFGTEACGARIEEADINYAKCSMELKPIHMNARGAVMGGVIFTLADFATAVAANGWRESPNTVAQDGQIDFLSPAKGKTLIAETALRKSGRTVSFFDVFVTDELGTKVAIFHTKTFTIQPR